MSEGTSCFDNKTLETVVPATLAILVGVWMVDGVFDSNKVNLNQPPALLLMGAVLFVGGWIYQAIDYQRQTDEYTKKYNQQDEPYAWIAPILIMAFAAGVMFLPHMVIDPAQRQRWFQIGGLAFGLAWMLWAYKIAHLKQHESQMAMTWGWVGAILIVVSMMQLFKDRKWDLVKDTLRPTNKTYSWGSLGVVLGWMAMIVALSATKGYHRQTSGGYYV